MKPMVALSVKTWVIVSYSRIQHVIIRESFWQRILELASVSIQTAREIETSTSYWWRNTQTVPDLNLEDAKKLRDQIICISNKAYRPIAGV
jgi:membrane protein YdbS with pleckstrin-like domain